MAFWDLQRRCLEPTIRIGSFKRTTNSNIAVTFAQNRITTLDWPLQSPDANPIENVWSVVKKKLAGRRAFTLNSSRACPEGARPLFTTTVIVRLIRWVRPSTLCALLCEKRKMRFSSKISEWKRTYSYGADCNYFFIIRLSVFNRIWKYTIFLEIDIIQYL